MKIVSIIQRYPPAVGGSETWCQEVSRYLARQGHDVKVLTLDVNKEEEFWRDPLDDERTVALGRLAFDEGVKVRRYRRSLPIYTLHHLVLKNMLDRLMRFHFLGPHSTELYGRMQHEIKQADVVFLYTMPYPHNFVAYAIARRLKKRVVMVPFFHPTHPHYERRANYWLMQHCDAVITMSEYEKRYLHRRGVPESKLHVTGCGIHTEQYRPQALEEFRRWLVKDYNLQPEDKIVTFVGRKIEDKGVGHLIEAVQGLLKEMPIRLFLVGPSFDWFKKLYTALPATDKERIIDMGTLSHQDKVNVLHLSDLLALPSKYESFGIVFLEAWICGVPVVGTDEGALPSIVGEEGDVVPFGKPEVLRAKIRDALNDTVGWQARGARGQQKVLDRYTWDAIGQGTEVALRRAFGRGRDTLKIIMCANAYPPHFIGGAELIAHEQAKELRKLGHDVIVFAGERNGKLPRHSMRLDEYQGIPVYRVCLHDQDYGYDHFNFYHEKVHELFDEVIDGYAPDVVHLHNLVGLGAGLVRVAKRRGMRTILTLHDYQGFCMKNTIMKTAQDICVDFSRCAECLPSISGSEWKNVPVRLRSDFMALQLDAVDAFISPSDYVARKYVQSGIAPERINVVWNGVDVDRFAAAPIRRESPKIRFTFVGYIGPHKGVPTILDALALLGERKAEMTVNFAGEGEGRGQYEKRVQELGWSGDVNFWGKIDNARITEVYRETDVLILPSIWPENQPVSITEAMASGIPVIASNMGGIPELIDDGESGFLFQPGNAQDLAAKMAEFLDDRSRLRKFGAAAHRKISNNSFQNQVQKILRIYTQERRADTECPEEPLIVCAGREVQPACARELEIFLQESKRRWRVMMADWLDEEQLKQAKLLWVTSRHAKVEEVAVGLRNQLPLLVDAENEALRSLCAEGECGLWYRDAFEAVECLTLLTEQEATRRTLGQNGFRLLYSPRLDFLKKGV